MTRRCRQVHKRHFCRQGDGRNRFLQGHPLCGKTARWRPALESTGGRCSGQRCLRGISLWESPVQAPGDPAAEYGMGEDCLYLNIWKTDEAAASHIPISSRPSPRCLW